MVGMGWFMCIVMIVCVISCVEAFQEAKFEELYRSSWAMDHCVNDGEVTKLKLDSSSGSFTLFLSSVFLFLKAFSLNNNFV